MPNSAEQICNQALSDIGGRVQIVSFLNDTTPTAIQCRLWYDTLRQNLLQAAPWSFARKTAALTQLAMLSDVPMPAGMYPWLVKYLYPTDCLRVNYILPPPLPPLPNGTPNVSGGPVFSNPWGFPSRANRFLRAYDEVVVVSPPSTTPREVLLSNIIAAYAVYVVDVTVPTMFDASFSLALTAAMSYKLVMPITGNAGMKSAFRQVADDAITAARVKDGNEAISSSDHTPDWMAARGGDYGVQSAGGFALGQWYNGYSDMSWGE